MTLTQSTDTDIQDDRRSISISPETRDEGLPRTQHLTLFGTPMNTSSTASSNDSVGVIPPPKNKKKKKKAPAQGAISSKNKPEKEKPKKNKTKERRFTLHTSDYALMDRLKATLKKSNRVVKKSDLVIAGLQALGQMPIEQLQAAIDDVRSVKRVRQMSLPESQIIFRESAAD